MALGLQRLKDLQSGKSNNVKSDLLKLKDGEKVEIRFLQEVDPNAANYSQRNGLGWSGKVVISPWNYRTTFQSNTDDGERDYALEMAMKYPKTGWSTKSHFYINVLVRGHGDSEPYVAVLKQTVYDKNQVTNMIIEYGGDNNTVTDIWWKFSRRGEGMTDTVYSLMPGKPVDEDDDVESYELIDLDTVIPPKLSYEEQRDRVEADRPSEPVESQPERPKVTTDVEW